MIGSGVEELAQPALGESDDVTGETCLVERAAEERRLLETWRTDFDQTWDEGQLAVRVRELPPAPNPLRLATLVELVKIDLKRRWQHGQRVRLGGYLKRYPELGTPDTVSVELIQAE